MQGRYYLTLKGGVLRRYAFFFTPEQEFFFPTQNKKEIGLFSWT
jgi:hypothetical protein